MKFVKRRTQISYKPITDQQWTNAYIRYLEISVLLPNDKEKYITIEKFKTLAPTIYHPLAEVDQLVETQEKFIERVTKIEKKKEYKHVQFISNKFGDIVSCVLF